MDIQQKIIGKIGIDRLLHFAFGWAISATVCLVLLLCGYRSASLHLIIQLVCWALSTGFVSGLLKELWDKYVKKSVFDPIDLLATFLGGVVTAIAMILMYVF